MKTLRKFVIEFPDGSIERLYLEDVEKREDGLYATIEKDGQRFTVKRVVDPTKEPEETGTRWEVVEQQAIQVEFNLAREDYHEGPEYVRRLYKPCHDEQDAYRQIREEFPSPGWRVWDVSYSRHWLI